MTTITSGTTAVQNAAIATAVSAATAVIGAQRNTTTAIAPAAPGAAPFTQGGERIAMIAPGLNACFNGQRFVADAETWLAAAQGGSGSSDASSGAGDAAGSAGGGSGRGRGPTDNELADLRAWLSSPRDLNDIDKKLSGYSWGQDTSVLIHAFIPLLRDPNEAVQGNAAIFLYLSAGGFPLECGRHYMGEVLDAERLELSVRTLHEVMRALADLRAQGRQLQPYNIRLQSLITREYTEFVLSDDDGEDVVLPKLRAWMRAVFERVEQDDDEQVRSEALRIRARAIAFQEYDPADSSAMAEEEISYMSDIAHKHHQEAIEQAYAPRGLAEAALDRIEKASQLWEILKDRGAWPTVSDQEISLLAGISLLGIASFSFSFIGTYLGDRAGSRLLTLARLAKLDSPGHRTQEEIDAFIAGFEEMDFKEAVDAAIHIAQCPKCERAYQETLKRRN